VSPGAVLAGAGVLVAADSVGVTAELLDAGVLAAVRYAGRGVARQSRRVLPVAIWHDSRDEACQSRRKPAVTRRASHTTPPHFQTTTHRAHSP
jgi:hypothetical protein